MFGQLSNAKFDPFEELEQIAGHLFRRDGKQGFKTDVKDLGHSYRLEADLPGVKKEDLKVDVMGDYLTISAQRFTGSTEFAEDKHFIRRERSYGALCRTFDISNVDAGQITARFADGVLTLTMPKKETAKTDVRRLEIE